MLSIGHLNVEFEVDTGRGRKALLNAVRDVSLTIEAGETVAIVGESGAGKSQIFHAVMGLLPGNGRTSGQVEFQGQSLLDQPDSVLNRIRGRAIGMIFQDPMTALNPYLRIGRQLAEVLEVHQQMSRRNAMRQARDMLERVHIRDPDGCLRRYPHELSGGMRQRVVIAMALLCHPQLVIADEPTTALDVTVQSGIIRLLREIHRDFNTAIALITHDLPLVAGLCDRIVVMYAGQIVESGSLTSLFSEARHPYTQALLAATPQHHEGKGPLPTIAGQPPDPLQLPTGCAFAPRCPEATKKCRQTEPRLEPAEEGHWFACWHPQITAIDTEKQVERFVS